MSKIGIIGAGASGVIAALNLSDEHEVTLIEKNDKILKKLLLTGNGRCNYWNDNISIDNYYSENIDILSNILTKDNIDYTYHFLEGLGIFPKIKNGLYYPYSNQAFSIKTLLENNLKKKNVNIILNSEVTMVDKKDNVFEVSTIKEKMIFDKVIISTGSKAYPKTGSIGDGYAFAQKFGLKISEILPALTSLYCHGDYFKYINGIRSEAKVYLLIDDKFIKMEEGEVQFTDYGVSGICVFNLSSLISKALNDGKKVKLNIDFLPKDFYIEDWFNKLNVSISEGLESLLSYKLTATILKKCNISSDAHYKSLTLKEKTDLLNNLTAFEIEVIKTNDFDKSQVCTGGVLLNEIDSNFEVKKVPNLYLTGEVLDVDGICGGFNLSFAFISGYVASCNINKKN